VLSICSGRSTTVRWASGRPATCHSPDIEDCRARRAEGEELMDALSDVLLSLDAGNGYARE
jgi:hypothetical protein